MQNPRNTINKLNSISGSAVAAGKPAVASAKIPAPVGQKTIEPSVSALPSAKAGATPISKSGNGVAAPKGVVLGTTKGNHHVAHAAGSGTGFATKTLMQGQ